VNGTTTYEVIRQRHAADTRPIGPAEVVASGSFDGSQDFTVTVHADV